ncbi:MAG TPA: retroviral-like aspartic protease family protein [Methylocystis sp.]|nr:retroviral-like aspartic protease family protein [Methylocystis sp.]
MSNTAPRAPIPASPSLWRNSFVVFLLAVGALAAWFHDDLGAIITGRRPGNEAFSQGPQEPPFSDVELAAVEARLAPFYERFKLAPLPRGVLAKRAVRDNLDRLRDQPCDMFAVKGLSAAMSGAEELRALAPILLAIGEQCPESEGALSVAANIYFNAGEFDAALDVAERLTRKHPDRSGYQFLKGRALTALKRHAEALNVYGSILRLDVEPKRVSPDVFIGMASAYEALGRFCEQAATLETFVAIQPELRRDPEIDANVAEARRRGACKEPREAVIVVPRGEGGLVRVRADVNGVAGNFALDTHATWASFSPDFARRAKLDAPSGDPARLGAIKGGIDVKLVTVDLIRLGRLEARDVPGVVSNRIPGAVSNKDLIKTLDGVLGMSFLSRFDLTLANEEWRLETKPRTK